MVNLSTQMKRIKLTQGKYAIVDDENFNWLNRWKWRVSTLGYAVRANYKNGKRIGDTFMQRFINNTPDGFDTDHKNRNKLDNKKSNLRTATRSQNNFNSEPPKTNTSGYKGVWWHEGQKRWWSHIQVSGKRIHLGSFITKKEAIDRRIKAERVVV